MQTTPVFVRDFVIRKGFGIRQMSNPSSINLGLLQKAKYSYGLSLIRMIKLERHFDRLQTALGKKNTSGKNSADRIDEELWWNTGMRELNQASYECADELQEETGQPYTKEYSNGTKNYDLNYEKAPPTRLLALSLILNYWLGFHDASRNHYLHEEPVAAWRRIKEAYDSGKAAHLPVNF
jgi:hypothetical protein